MRLGGWFEGEHALDVPGQGDEAPFAAYLVEPAQRELSEAEHRFDDAEHRFGRLLAQGIELLALGRRQAMGHGLDRGRICPAPAVRRRSARLLTLDRQIGLAGPPMTCRRRSGRGVRSISMSLRNLARLNRGHVDQPSRRAREPGTDRGACNDS